MPVCFWGDEDGSKYHAAYFEQYPGIWAHGDFAQVTEHGGMSSIGRSDATLNPGGVRIGTAEIYRQVESLDEVLESICVGQDWDDDVRVVLFVRLREGVQLDEALQDGFAKAIRQNTTPRHVPARIIQVPDIPRTISGKIVELAVRNIIHGRAVATWTPWPTRNRWTFTGNLPELQVLIMTVTTTLACFLPGRNPPTTGWTRGGCAGGLRVRPFPLESSDPRHVPVALEQLGTVQALEVWRCEGPIKTGSWD